MIPDAAADTRNHQNERLKAYVNNSTDSKLFLAAYTYSGKTYIEIRLEHNGTTQDFSETYYPHANQTVKAIGHSVLHAVMSRFRQRPLNVYYTLTGLGNGNIHIEPEVFYKNLPPNANPMHDKIKERIKNEARQ